MERQKIATTQTTRVNEYHRFTLWNKDVPLEVKTIHNRRFFTIGYLYQYDINEKWHTKLGLALHYNLSYKASSVILKTPNYTFDATRYNQSYIRGEILNSQMFWLHDKSYTPKDQLSINHVNEINIFRKVALKFGLNLFLIMPEYLKSNYNDASFRELSHANLTGFIGLNYSLTKSPVKAQLKTDNKERKWNAFLIPSYHRAYNFLRPIKDIGVERKSYFSRGHEAKLAFVFNNSFILQYAIHDHYSYFVEEYSGKSFDYLGYNKALFESYTTLNHQLSIGKILNPMNKLNLALLVGYRYQNDGSHRKFEILNDKKYDSGNAGKNTNTVLPGHFLYQGLQLQVPITKRRVRLNTELGFSTMLGNNQKTYDFGSYPNWKPSKSSIQGSVGISYSLR